MKKSDWRYKGKIIKQVFKEKMNFNYFKVLKEEQHKRHRR